MENVRVLCSLEFRGDLRNLNSMTQGMRLRHFSAIWENYRNRGLLNERFHRLVRRYFGRVPLLVKVDTPEWHPAINAGGNFGAQTLPTSQLRRSR
jgi:hypothetical protein